MHAHINSEVAPAYGAHSASLRRAEQHACFRLESPPLAPCPSAAGRAPDQRLRAQVQHGGRRFQQLGLVVGVAREVPHLFQWAIQLLSQADGRAVGLLGVADGALRNLGLVRGSARLCRERGGLGVGHSFQNKMGVWDKQTVVCNWLG